MNCACGKTALYKVGEHGYCAGHQKDAVARIAKFGMPKARRKPNPSRFVHVDKPTNAEAREKFRKDLKSMPTPSETLVRDMLREHPETKGMFAFQAAFNGYIPDFICHKSRLIIEVDGWHHRTTAGKRQDARRTAHLTKRGYKVIRFMNRAVSESPNFVMDMILLEHRARLNHDVRQRCFDGAH